MAGNWEEGYAYPDRGQIRPDQSGSSIVDFSPAQNPVTEGPVRFQRSDSDPSWAVKVVNSSIVVKLLSGLAESEKLTTAGKALVAAEAASFVAAAGRAPSETLKEKHLDYARDRLSGLAAKANRAARPVGVKTIRRYLAKRPK